MMYKLSILVIVMVAIFVQATDGYRPFHGRGRMRGATTNALSTDDSSEEISQEMPSSVAQDPVVVINEHPLVRRYRNVMAAKLESNNDNPFYVKRNENPFQTIEQPKQETRKTLIHTDNQPKTNKTMDSETQPWKSRKKVLEDDKPFDSDKNVPNSILEEIFEKKRQSNNERVYPEFGLNLQKKNDQEFNGLNTQPELQNEIEITQSERLEKEMRYTEPIREGLTRFTNQSNQSSILNPEELKMYNELRLAESYRVRLLMERKLTSLHRRIAFLRKKLGISKSSVIPQKEEFKNHDELRSAESYGLRVRMEERLATLRRRIAFLRKKIGNWE